MNKDNPRTTITVGLAEVCLVVIAVCCVVATFWGWNAI